MQALLSPHSSTALVFQDQNTFLVGQGNLPQPLPSSDVAAWLSAHEETRWQSAESFPEVENALSLYSRRKEALDLSLICLDGELSLELRDEALQELENMLAEPPVRDWIENLFHLRPLPKDTVLTKTITRAHVTECQRVIDFLTTIASRQSTIAQSWAAWSVIQESLFESDGGYQRVLEFFLENGVFVSTIELLDSKQTVKAKSEDLEHIKGLIVGKDIRVVSRAKHL